MNSGKLENSYLVIPKILYFIVNLQYFALHSFRVFFAVEKFKISISKFGKYTGIAMFISFFTNILIGNISDKKKKYKQIILFLTIITTVIFTLFYIKELTNIHISVFWGLFILYIIFNNPKQPLLDKIILDYISKLPCGTGVYGKQRLWGTVSYFLGSYVIEWCLNQGGSKGNYNWDNLLYYCFVTTFLSFICIVFFIRDIPAGEIPKQKNVKEQHEITNENSSSNIKNGYITLLKNKEYLFFIIIMFSNAVTRSSMSTYLSVYHKDILKLNAPSAAKTNNTFLMKLISSILNKPMSVLLFFGTFFEVTVMFFSHVIIEKFGLFLPLLIAQIFSLVRFFAYFALPYNSKYKYGLSCLFELIKGLYFALAHMSGVQIASKLAPSNLCTTSQMIYQGTFNALGSLFSGYFFGYIFDKSIKGNDINTKRDAFNRLFLINIFISFITSLVYFLKYGIIDKILFNKSLENKKLEQSHPQETSI